MGKIERRLSELGETLPPPKTPVANYLGTKRSGDLLFVSARVSRQRGEVGTDVTSVEAKQAARSEEAAKASSPAVPALAHVAGVWQPGVIVEEPTSGWATVFLPEVPGLATGRLYCLQDAQVLRLETPLDDFREMLSSSGKGSGDWLTALAAVQAAQT